MALISAEELRERFDIDSNIEDPRLKPHIGSASRRLRKWVGATNYAAAVDEAKIDAESDDEMLNELRNAEANLAFHFAIYGLNAPLSGKGVLATATSTEGKEVRRYLSPDETAKLSGQFLELAREIAEPYMTAADDSGVEIVTCEE